MSSQSMIGFTIGSQRTRKDYRHTGAVTGDAVWTPASGKRILLTDVIFTTSAAATVTLFVGSDAAGNRIIDGDFAANSGVAHPFRDPVEFDPDAILKVTTTAGNIKLVVFGYEA